MWVLFKILFIYFKYPLFYLSTEGKNFWHLRSFLPARLWRINTWSLGAFLIVRCNPALLKATQWFRVPWPWLDATLPLAAVENQPSTAELIWTWWVLGRPPSDHPWKVKLPLELLFIRDQGRMLLPQHLSKWPHYFLRILLKKGILGYLKYLKDLFKVLTFIHLYFTWSDVRKYVQMLII